MFFLLRSLVCGALLCVAMTAHCMEYHKQPFGNDGSIIFLYGAINDGDTQKLAQLVHPIPSDRIFTFVFHSPGGNVDEAYRMALFLRSINARTMIGDKSICAAACILPFYVGRIKIVHPGAKIIVHGTASAQGLDNVAALDSMNKIALYARELGIPQSIIRKMVVMPQGAIEPLSRADILAMGAEIPPE